MTDFVVGKEVLSYCSKCKLTLAHVIVAMKDVKTIGKCQCSTCKATHAFKDPGLVKIKKPSIKGKPKSRRIEVSVGDLWLEAVNKSTAKMVAYTPKGKFIVGDKIDHATFGPGVVDRVVDTNKIEVIFRHEIKTLVHCIE